MPINKPERGAYRRGAVLGLTLAELMLLILFLFMLLAAAIMFRDQQRFEAVDQERLAFREAFQDQLGAELGADIAANLSSPLTPEQLAEPLARLGELSAQNVRLRIELEAAQTELVALREGVPSSAQEASQLRQQAAILEGELNALRDQLGDVQALVQEAHAVDANRNASETLSAALASYAALGDDGRALPDQLAACRAEGLNTANQLAYAQAQCGREGDFPPCVYRDDGQIAYSFDVTLVPAGIVVAPGDQGSFRQLPWVASLPTPTMGAPLTVPDFQRMTRAYLDTGNAQDPQCRFFVRIYNRMGDRPQGEFVEKYVGVQSNFYQLLVNE